MHGLADLSLYPRQPHCRIVSRGKLSNQASDFGGLEVFAGASIGHTDPFVVAAMLQQTMRDVVVCS